jgi:endonuclease/exonuclease/phosphatase family metal-dependent hydrolase
MRRTLTYLILFLTLIFFGCRKESGKNTLKVITFNIRYDNPRDSMNAWPNRAEMAGRFLIDEEPDLIGMQEVLARQYEYLDSALVNYGSVAVGRSDGARGGEMNPVFYRKDRFDLIRTITFWLSGTPGTPGSKDWGAGLPRIVTWIELAEKGTQKHLFFFNTHFAHDSDSARIRSSSLLLQKVDSIASGFPFIITGDFNQLPDSKGYSILTGPFESVPLLRDSHSISQKKPGGPLYTFNGFTDKIGSGRIDYIFVRDGMKVLDHKTILKKENGIFISDHWPVIAVVGFKDQ